MRATSSGYTVLFIACPLHSSHLSASDGQEFEGQEITVPTGIAPVLLTDTVVGSKLAPSTAAKAGITAKRHNTATKKLFFMALNSPFFEQSVHDGHGFFNESYLQQEVRIGIDISTFFSADARGLQSAEAEVRVEGEDGDKFVLGQG